MVATQRPDVPWGEIRQRIMSGESGKAISEDLAERGIKISRQAINQKASNQGWRQTERPAERPAATMEIVRKAEQSPAAKATPELIDVLLYNLRLGVSRSTACAIAGIDRSTFYDWLKLDPQFLQEIDRAEAEYEATHQRVLHESSADRNDWRASLENLRHHPKSRERYADKASGGGSVNVTINVPRGDEPIIIEGSKN